MEIPLPPSPASSFFQSTLFLHIILPLILVVLVATLIIIMVLCIRLHRKSKLASITSSAFRAKISHHKMGMSVSWDEYKCIHRYEPSMPDELELLEGDIVFKLLEYDDGWAKGYNTRSQEEGIYPLSFTEKVNRVK
jgi:hypothetical protein